jgi:putative nucleotidyltransferase with HDIG domain
MWDYLKRQQLQRKGLSCGKKRREQANSEWLETVRSSPYVRGLFITLFLAGLGALVRYLPPGSGFQFLQASSGLATPLVLAVLVVSMVHLKVAEPATWCHNSRVLLVYLVILLQIGLVQLADFLLQINQRPAADILLYAPCALAPITLTLLVGVPLGFFAAIYASLWGAMMVPHDHSFAFLLFSLSTGLVGVLTTRHLRKRSQLMRAGLYIGLTGLFLAFALQHMTSPLDLLHGLGWQRFGIQAGSLLVAAIVTISIVNGLLPILEGIFKITTPISWIELSDLNHPLLRRLTMEAPGTYHHSLQVASLAEGAAEAIGADATQCRVCSYFHDIGKLERPEYCIENIHGNENPHNDLSPSMSALIIISHVKDGVDLALKHKLNREIINVIQQHHGNSLVWFFYRRALDHQEEVRKQVALGNAKPTDVPEISEKEFRYPGPRPQSRESAIISLADAVESASRVLQKPTPQKIEQMINEIVSSRLKDGQLDECDLTLGELDKVKESFQARLRTILHRRIPYPDEKAPAEKERGKPKTDTVTNMPVTTREEKPASKQPVLSAAASLLENAETARFGVRPAN